MSTNFYLHSTDFPESVHIGASSGAVWTTDTSLARQGDALGWRTTAGLVACLKVQGSRGSRFPSWVADEYGRTFAPWEAVVIIMTHGVHRELDVAFT